MTTTYTNEIDVRQAVSIARQQANILFQDEPLPNLALEEVELDEDKQEWLITLGYDSPHTIVRKTGMSLFPNETEEEIKRVYKIFRIRSSDGKFISMRIRNV